MANLTSNQTTFELKANKAISLFANASSVGISYDAQNATFNSFSLRVLNSVITAQLSFRDAKNATITIDNPVFTFDESTNELYLLNNDVKYVFTFFNKQQMSFCTLKDLGLGCSCN